MWKVCLVALLVGSCGGALSSEPLPPECALPSNAEGFVACHAETLDDGADRKVCTRGEETWVLYPTGEAWHWRNQVASSSQADKDILCHVHADGTIGWPYSDTP